jgi:hypothetical protein
MSPKSGNRFPACAKPCQRLALSVNASAGEARSDKIMRKQYGQTVIPINPVVP